MKISTLWKMVILISSIFLAFKRMTYHIEHALPHFFHTYISSPPYSVLVSYPGYYSQWKYVLLWVVIGLILCSALVLVMQNIKEEI